MFLGKGTSSSGRRRNVGEIFRRWLRRGLEGRQFGAPAFFQLEDVVVFGGAPGPLQFFEHLGANWSFETPTKHRENEGVVFAMPLHGPLHAAADFAIGPPSDPGTVDDIGTAATFSDGAMFVNPDDAGGVLAGHDILARE